MILDDKLTHKQGSAEEDSRSKHLIDHVRDILLEMDGGLVKVSSGTTGLAGPRGLLLRGAERTGIRRQQSNTYWRRRVCGRKGIRGRFARD